MNVAGNGFFASVYAVDFQSPLVHWEIICSSSGSRSCNKRKNEERISVMDLGHHLRHQVTSLISSRSWPMTTTDHFFTASRGEMK